MIKIFSIEFWIGVQLIVDFIFVVLLFGFVRQLKKNGKSPKKNNDDLHNNSYGLREKTVKTAGEIIEILEPLVHDSEAAAEIFDRQIKEKKNIIQKLNDALDSRIISINLLLSRAETLFETLQQNNFHAGKTHADFDCRNSFHHSHSDVFDQQREILDLYARGDRIESIASKLAMPEGEVNLVISLKEKFIKMENQE